jgi:hypothetical protein
VLCTRSGSMALHPNASMIVDTAHTCKWWHAKQSDTKCTLYKHYIITEVMASHLAGNCSKYSSGGTVVGAFWHLNGIPIPCSLPVVVHSAVLIESQ